MAASNEHHVYVDVSTTSHPVPGAGKNTYECEADVRVTDGPDGRLYKTHLTIHHPRGWMGVEAGFVYLLDDVDFPTFGERADEAYRRSVAACSTDRLISVFLLGTGKPVYAS